AAHEILATSRSFEAAEAERLGFVQRLAEPGAWPEIVRGIVDAQRLDGTATVHLKARVKPDMRASAMAALVDSAATPGPKGPILPIRGERITLAEGRCRTGFQDRLAMRSRRSCRWTPPCETIDWCNAGAAIGDGGSDAARRRPEQSLRSRPRAARGRARCSHR